jgi:hypothetical protein
MTNVVALKPVTKVSGGMSPETAAWVNKFIAHNAYRMGSHGPMTIEVRIKLLLEDVAAAMRDGGNSWQGCHAATLLLEHGYRLYGQRPRSPSSSWYWSTWRC